MDNEVIRTSGPGLQIVFVVAIPVTLGLGLFVGPLLELCVQTESFHFCFLFSLFSITRISLPGRHDHLPLLSPPAGHLLGPSPQALVQAGVADLEELSLDIAATAEGAACI